MNRYTAKEMKKLFGFRFLTLKTECIKRGITPIREKNQTYYTDEMVRRLKEPPTFLGLKELSQKYQVPMTVMEAKLEVYGVEKIVECNNVYYRVSEADAIDFSRTDDIEEYDKNKDLERLTKISNGEAEEATINAIAAIVDRTREEVEAQFAEWGISPKANRGGIPYYDISALERLYQAGYRHLSGEDYVTREDAIKELGIKEYRWMAEMTLGGVNVVNLFRRTYIKKESLDYLKENGMRFESVTVFLKDKDVDFRMFHRIIEDSGIEGYQIRKTIVVYDRKDLEKCFEEYKAVEAEKDKRDAIIRAYTKYTVGTAVREFLEDACFPYFQFTFGGKIPDTLQQVKFYLSQKAAKNKARDEYLAIRRYAKSMENMLKALTKELKEYTDDEITELLEGLSEEMTKRETVYFLEFLKEREECRFLHIRKYIKISPANPQKGYTQEEWGHFLKTVLDIEAHSPKARESDRYAQLWLFMLLHTFLAWRAQDFCKFPAPLDIVSDDGITMNEAMLILEDAEEKINGLTAGKTGEQLFFTMPPTAVILPLAYALTICNTHRKENGRDSLIESKVARSYSFMYEFNQIGLRDFRSIRANKTLETSIYRTASVWPGHVAVAYKAASKARSHRTDLDEFSEMTAVYIDLLPKEAGGFSDDLCEALCRRGLFGFLYEELLMILSGRDTKEISFFERTELITQIQQVMPIQQANELAGYMVTSLDCKRKKVIEEWNDTEVLKSRIADALQTSGNGKQMGIICTNPYGCNQKTMRSCMECPYALLPVHEILKVNRRMHDILDRLSRLKPDSEAERNLQKKYMGQLTYYMQLANSFRTVFGGNEDMMAVLYHNDLKEKMLMLKGN